MNREFGEFLLPLMPIWMVAVFVIVGTVHVAFAVFVAIVLIDTFARSKRGKR